MKQRKRNPDPALTRAAWQDVLARGFQAFAYYHRWSLEQRHPTILADAARLTVQNAALESSLMSMRDLDGFFLSGPTARPDDLIATDYGFPAGRGFLKDQEREAINKKLAHLTNRAALELQQDPLRKNPRSWNNAEMVDRAASRLLEFLDHLESTFFAGDLAQTGLICSARDTIKLTLTSVRMVAKTELNFKA